MRYIISFWDHTIFNNFFFFSLPLPRVPCHFFSPSLSLSLSLSLFPSQFLLFRLTLSVLSSYPHRVTVITSPSHTWPSLYLLFLFFFLYLSLDSLTLSIFFSFARPKSYPFLSPISSSLISLFC